MQVAHKNKRTSTNRSAETVVHGMCFSHVQHSERFTNNEDAVMTSKGYAGTTADQC